MSVYCLQLHIIDCCEEACSLSLYQNNLSVWNLLEKIWYCKSDFQLNSVIKKKNFDQTSLRWAAKTKTFNDKILKCGCKLYWRNTSDGIKFISWDNQSLHCSQNHVLTPTSDFEAFHCFETREKNMKFLSGCLGYQKFWFHNYILRGSEILKTFLYCIFV